MMTKRTAGARRVLHGLLALGLFLSGLVGVAGHEHASDALRAAASACFVDHDGHVPVAAERPGDQRKRPWLDEAGTEHEHRCLACHTSRVRGADVAATTNPTAPALVGRVGSLRTPLDFGTPFLSPDARGPPDGTLS